jgi:cell wall-associated NlpC family hydrolase
LTVRLFLARAALAGTLAALGAGAAPASAGTSVSNVGGVEVIVSTPDQPAHPAARPAANTRRASVPARAPLPGGRAGALVRTAMSLVGTPYVWGGTSPSGFDCSGFVWYAYNRIGITIPRTADVQFAVGRPVDGDPLPGDLVFFQTYDYGASHVGLYIGNGWFVNAIGTDVHLASFASDYFRGRYLGARRFLS